MTQLEVHIRHAYPGGFQLRAAFDTRSTITALFGPSGSGKTTVLEMIAGLRRPVEGRIALGDRVLLDTGRRTDVPAYRRRIGMVFQDQLLFPHLSVEQNLRFGARRRRTGPRVEFHHVTEVLELEPLLKRHPRNLSGGERQRVALGRALLSRPELLVMDEPLVALDEGLKLRILAYLERLAREYGIPTLFVSHSQAEVRRLADWVVVLRDGEVVAEGLPDDVLSSREALASANGAGPVNLLRVHGVTCREGTWLGHVGPHPLVLPALGSPPGEKLYVQLDPAAVLLSRQDVPGVSARNHLPGTVTHVVTLEDSVFVCVDVTQPLWAKVTPSAVEELGLTPGVAVTCLVKAHSLRPLPA